MRGFYLLRWVLLALFLAGLVYVIATSDCWHPARAEEVRVVLTLSWPDVLDRPRFGIEGVPGGVVPGPRVAPSVESVTRQIDGAEYVGLRCSRREWDEKGSSSTQAVEAVARQAQDTLNTVRFFVSSDFPWQLEIEDVEGAVLRYVETKHQLAAPYQFDPGEYHLEAVMAEALDEE